MRPKPRAVVIVGPTSSGKTEWSLALAKKFGGVIISADSRQIYKGLDIATAKTTKREQQGIPHYMIDIVNPDEDFSVSLYQATVYNLLSSIVRSNIKRSKKTAPFIVGGTGLYIKAVIDGYKIPRVSPNKELRAKLTKMPISKLVAKLKRLSAKHKTKPQVNLTNQRRLIRAIEVLEAVGQILPAAEAPNFDFLQIGIDISKAELYQKIEKKINQMYQDGLVKETKRLLAAGYDFDLPAFSALGYQHIHNYLKDKTTLKKALELMKQDTKRFAKRQLTWFKRDRRIHWVKTPEAAAKLIQSFLRIHWK